jgi:hypothetical protein
MCRPIISLASTNPWKQAGYQSITQCFFLSSLDDACSQNR